MTTIHNISSPDALADLCATIWEHPAFAREGKPKCWHVKNQERDVMYKIIEGRETMVLAECTKCGKSANPFMDKLCNPDLLHDLNIWHELEGYLWKAGVCIENPPIHLSDYARVLTRIAGGVVTKTFPDPDGDSFEVIQLDSGFFLAHAKAHHKAEAFATLLDVECEECGGDGGIDKSGVGLEQCLSSDIERCPTCHGTKRVPIIDQWEIKWRGK